MDETTGTAALEKTQAPPAQSEDSAGQNDAVRKHRYLSPKEIFAMGAVAFGQKNLDEFCNANLQFFIIQFFGLSPNAYANISLGASIYDALDDTLSGLIIDRTRTRWGRIKPYLILPIPLWLIGTVMLFSAPALSPAMKIVWVTFATILKGLGMSYFGAWTLMQYNVTPNYNERVSAIATVEFARLFGTFLISALPFVLDIGRSNNVAESTVYNGFSWVIVLLCAATCIYGFRHMRERIPLQSREEMKEVGVFESFKHLAKNRPMFILILGNFFNSFKSIGAGNEKFFWFNCTGKYSYATIVSLFTGLPNYIMTPLSSKIIHKFGARNTMIGAGLFGGIAYTLMYLIGYHPFGATFQDNVIAHLVWMAFSLTVCGLPNRVISVALAVLSGDVFDYSEWKTGMRNEAIVTTIQNYFMKIGNSFNAWLTSMVLTWIGYQALTDAEGIAIPNTDPGVQRGLWIIFALAPAAARLLTGIAFMFFNIHGKFKEQMLADLEERRKAAIEELEESEAEMETDAAQ
ncbi:MAG: MFS transporter [Clostridia bacterium]|nr:MFS transporter [Clostridia bacterium]